MRQLRRSSDFRQRPCQLEIDACEKAFELDSDAHPDNISMGSAVAMTRLYGELLLNCRRGSMEHQELSERAVTFSR